jgi:hypothetical protein
LAQLAPPQSVSVSVPLRTPSLQLSAWHSPPEHTALLQSEFAVHPLPVPQRAHVVAPPQSTSVSPPFSVLSEQVAC